MPLFELDGERSRLVQPMQPVGGTFADEMALVLRRHLVTVVGEPVFVVAQTDGEPADRPAVLALDRQGRRLVVEVVHRLDLAALGRALRHAGEVTQLTSSDLVREYGAGPAGFASDWRAFRDALPFGVAEEARGPEARLIVLCAKVARDAQAAVTFLAGRRVRVVQVGVVRAADGRRLLDFGPLATHEPDRRAIEPSGDRMVLSRGAQVAASIPAPAPVPQPTANEPVRAVPAATPTPRAPIEPLAGPDARPAPSPSTNGRAATAQAPVADPRLARLAARGAAVDLVWERRRRGQTVRARLRPDGLVELGDGRVFADPSHAATAAVNAENPVDGWRQWRVGAPDGPVLVDAAR